MIPIPLPVSPLLQKVFLGVFVFLSIVIVFQLHRCRQDKKNKQLIEHNNKKRDAAVNTAVERIDNFSETRKIENSQPVKLKVAPDVYLDKECILQKTKPCANNQICIDRVMETANADCQMAIEELSPEEIKKRRNEALIQLKNMIVH